MKKTFILSSLVLLSIFIGFATTAYGEAGAVTITDPLGGIGFSGLLKNIAKGVAGVVGSLAVIMFIISGIMYLTSAGSPERINQAKGCLVYAVIGVVIALSAEGLALFMTSTLGVK